ncbi:hypothetical protein Lal_00001355 [Lupinus albus]|nr:hypothetical protein Lal_00001355 [Lupinus albus]
MEREQQKASLNSPLIQNIEQDGSIVDVEKSKSSAIGRSEFLEEVRRQLWLAGPLIIVNLLNYSLQVISVMFVGHLGELALSGTSIASSFASVTGFTFLIGMASALETLCGQSYGAKQYRMLGIHMQRSMFTLMIVGIPIAIIWANTKSILIFLGQDPEISHEAGKYAQVMVPTIFAYGLLVSLNRFLQTQHIVFPMVFFSGVATLLHVLLCWVMVFKCELGNRGAAISSSIAYWFNVLMLSLYVKFSPSCAKTWTGFSKEAFQCVSFVRLAIPSALMVCLEMWSFEMVVLLSGLLPNPKLETSVLSICLNTVGVIWMIPLGLGGAVRNVRSRIAEVYAIQTARQYCSKVPLCLHDSCSTRVSNELGAGHPQVARLAVRVVFALVFVEAIVIGVVTILIRNIWGYAYSNEVEVVKHVAEMMPILAVSNFLDGFQGVLSGTTRGCGRQKFGAYVNLGSYYLVGLPLAAVFAFVLHIGGKGLWLGIICALSVQVVSFLIVTLCTDWEQEAKKAADRVYDSLVPENTVS